VNTDSNGNANGIPDRKRTALGSVATLALRLCRMCSASKTYPEYPERSGERAPLAVKGVRGKGRQPFSLPSSAETLASVSSAAQCRAFLPIESPHLKAMGVVNQAVEDAGGAGGITDLLVPARDR
jgi:hypothetical protein